MGPAPPTTTHASGAHPIVATDPGPSQLDFAKWFVLLCVWYEVDRTGDVKRNTEAIRAFFASGEHVTPDPVPEFAGVKSSMCTAAH